MQFEVTILDNLRTHGTPTRTPVMSPTRPAQKPGGSRPHRKHIAEQFTFPVEWAVGSGQVTRWKS